MMNMHLRLRIVIANFFVDIFLDDLVLMGVHLI